MKTCTECQIEKNDEHFRPFARGRRKVCIACESGGGSAVKTKKTAPADEPIAAEVSDNVVEIQPSMGARVRIVSDVLEIEQDRKAEDGEFYTYTITLYPHEARQVIDAIASFVEKAA